MKLPSLNEIATSRNLVDVFKGYNHNLRIGDDEFYDMKNLTSTHYPVLSPRAKRGTYVTITNPQGMIAKDALCYVDNGKFYINEYPIEGFTLDSETEKSLVSMGAYVVIFPDKKWINTAKWDGTSFDAYDKDGNLVGYGDIDAEFETIADYTKFTLCKADGTSYGEPYRGESEPKYTVTEDGKTVNTSPPNGQLWLDTSSVPHSLKMYSSSSGMWVSIATTYIKIESSQIDKKFELYDGITISGLGEENILHNYQADNEEITGHLREQLKNLDGSAVVWAKGENYIVIVGILDREIYISNKITISRKMPDVDFVIESQNRLFGCKYGISNKGETVNEIYTSKLGDFKNWNCFMGLSTDSYVASCGTDGKFTGAITHLGYPLFFKENCVHKVYGNYPANFQIQSTACRGVQEGSSKSLAIVNETLFYKSRAGICAYDGSLPTEVSAVLGEVAYSDAVAVAHGNKYYISMKDTEGTHHLFVYDVRKGLWHKEDNLAVKEFCSCRNEVYYIPQNSTEIKTMFGSGTVDNSPIKWMAETGAIGMYTPDKKYISRLNIRMSMEIGTKVVIYAQYDSIGEWEHLCTMNSTSLRSFSIPLRPKRCDHFRIRIEGEGDARIFSIVKTLEQGSDI
jgi:hypothetical protein